MRHNSPVSRERASEAAAATQSAAASGGGTATTSGSAGAGTGAGTGTGAGASTITATSGATISGSGTGTASAHTNSNSSASSSTVAAAQAAVYSGGNTVTGSLGSGGVVARGFRSHSPTHRRRSRERQRRTHGSDQGGLLAYSGYVGAPVDMTDFGAPTQGGGGGGGGGGGSAGTGSGLEDSRLSGNEDYYSSFVSDEFDSSKKLHRRCHERSSSVQAIDRLNTKIQCTKESIRQEQTARDGK